MSGSMQTPWGVAQTRWQLDIGVFWVQTEDQGGLLIDKAKAEELLSNQARALGTTWNDFLAFSQEDEISVIFYEHPELYHWLEEEFTEDVAEESLRREHPEYFLVS